MPQDLPQEEQQATALENPGAPMLAKLSLPAMLALLTVAIVTYFLAREDSNPLLETSESEQIPDSYTVKVHSFAYSKDGALEYTLRADDAAHYPHSDESLLTRPRLRHVPAHGPVWTSDAQFGKIRPGGEAVDLWDDVVIKRAGDGLQMSSESITVYPRSNTAETSAHVVVTSQSGRVDGNGMHANLETEIIKLLADVRALHEPKY